MNGSAALRSAWKQQSIWSRTANRMKRRLTRARLTVLVLSILAAVLGTLSSRFADGASGLAAPGGTLGVAAAVAIAVAGVLKTRALNRNQVRDWTQARSVSEAIKKQVYLCLTGAGEYGGADGAERLSREVSRLLARVRHLEPLAACVESEDRPVPRPLDGYEYAKVRLSSQIDDYYEPRARQLARRLAWLRRLEFALTGAAAVLGGTAILGTAARTGAWVAVITTVTAALLAHAEASRYEQSVISYRATANRLSTLRDQWIDTTSGREPTPQETALFVEQCETAISIENQGWMAEWSDSRG